MVEKLLKYQQILEAILFEPYETIVARISELVLHASFDLIQPNHNLIDSFLAKIDFYELWFGFELHPGGQASAGWRQVAPRKGALPKNLKSF